MLTLLVVAALLSCLLDGVAAAREVVYAVNCGGEGHVDVHGIHYKRDPLNGKVGTSSDFGRRLIIARSPPEDQILYQTERYHHSKFGYDVSTHLFPAVSLDGFEPGVDEASFAHHKTSH